MKISTDSLELIRCQKCLNPLEQIDNTLQCKSCGKKYPVCNNLIFMGFDAAKESLMNQIIEEEHAHQNDLENLEADFAFAYPSFKIALLTIPVLRKLVDKKNAVALDIGSGGAPFAKMLTEQGFNTFRLELDPNSLYSGFIFDHPDLGLGKNIVSDASILPFADNSVDVVFSKEFIHHIEDYEVIFAEINRILKKGGVFLMIEPANKFSFLRSKKENESIKQIDHHLTSIFNYRRGLRKNGFRIKRYYLYHYLKSKRIKILNKLKEYLVRQIRRKSTTFHLLIPFKMLMQRIISGQNIIYAEKVRKSKFVMDRPNIKIVDPFRLVIDESFINDPRLERYHEILDEVRREVDQS